MKAPTTHLLYLHGFRSSPQSAKARRLAQWLAVHAPAVRWCCPQLPPSPCAAVALADAATRGWPAATSAVVGSSLGGFYATALAESPARAAWRAVVLNPAVDPARDLARHVGEQTAFHDPQARFFFRAEFVGELRALATGPITAPARYLAVVATGDELLDWREMHARYASARPHVVAGSDHGLTDFDDHLPAITGFLGLCD